MPRKSTAVKAAEAAAQSYADPGRAMEQEAKRAPAREVVTVGCKVGLPGLILKIYDLVDHEENTQTGVRKIKIAQETGETFYIRGTAVPRGQLPEGFQAPIMLNGAAITTNVDKRLWDKWFEANKKSAMVTNGLIFAVAANDRASLRSAVNDHAGQTSGLEPLNVKKGSNDPRLLKSVRPEVSAPETEEGRAKAQRDREDIDMSSLGTQFEV